MSRHKQQAAPQYLFYGWVVVAVCVLVKIVKCPGQNNVMAYTVPHIQDELGLSEGELGALFSVATVSASSVQPFFGRCLDRLGARICLPVALLCFCLTMFCFSQAQRLEHWRLEYAQVVVLFFFVRSLSIGALEIFPSACVQKWFVRRRGRALAIMVTLQNIGLGVVGSVISEVVLVSGWRTAAQVGALANLALVPVAALLLRSSPESWGLAPDGDGAMVTVPVEEPAEPGKGPVDSLADDAAGASSPPPLPRGVTPILVFGFFYALMYGGCDFEIMEMVDEAGGEAGGVNVAIHVFLPSAVIPALGTPLLGELMDKCTQGRTLAFALLVLCALATFFATNLLCYLSTPTLGVVYGSVRGLSILIFQALCSSGLAFAALGVTRDSIGRMLGINQLATIAGTGFGPLVYGISKDWLGSYRLSLQLSSLPPLFLGLLFLLRAVEAQRTAAVGSKPSVQPAQSHATGGEVSPVLGKALGEAEAGTREAAQVGAHTPKASDNLLAQPAVAASEPVQEPAAPQ